MQMRLAAIARGGPAILATRSSLSVRIGNDPREESDRSSLRCSEILAIQARSDREAEGDSSLIGRGILARIVALVREEKPSPSRGV